MHRPLDHVGGAAHLDDAAGIHHGDAVGEPGDDGKIVCHPDHRGVALAAQPLRLEQDLALDGDVERRGGLVGHDQPGFVQQRDGDRHTLAHAARELVRIGAQPLVGRGDADLYQRGAGTCERVGAAHFQMRLHRLDHLRVDPQDRIERHHRVLEDHRDLRAANRAQAVGLRGRQLFVAQFDRAALDDAARRIDQPQDREAGDRLARARFAHQAQDLARRHVEIDTVHGLGHAFLGEEVRAQVADAEGWRRAHRKFRGFSTSRR